MVNLLFYYLTHSEVQRPLSLYTPKTNVATPTAEHQQIVVNSNSNCTNRIRTQNASTTL